MIIGDDMKRRIYFIISSLIQIGVSIYAIFSASKLGKALLKTLDAYPEALKGRIESLFSNGGANYIVVIAIITIILNVFILIWALSDKLLKKKGKVIACSVISIFTSTYEIIELLAIINIIIMAISKRVRKEDYPDPKEPLPIMEKESIDKGKIIVAVILIFVYFSQFILDTVCPDIRIVQLILGISFYVIMTVLTITLLFDLLKDSFNIFRKHFKAYVSNLIGTIGKFYLVYLGIAIVAAVLSKVSTPTNQTNIESLSLWISVPLAVIYAPIVEEAIFRGCIRRFIKNDVLFIIVSAITFGLLHTAFSETTIYNVLVLGIPYITIGGFLAYLYVKTNNICTNMAFHAFHNGMVMILIILMKLF